MDTPGQKTADSNYILRLNLSTTPLAWLLSVRKATAEPKICRYGRNKTEVKNGSAHSSERQDGKAACYILDWKQWGPNLGLSDMLATRCTTLATILSIEI